MANKDVNTPTPAAQEPNSSLLDPHIHARNTSDAHSLGRCILGELNNFIVAVFELSKIDGLTEKDLQARCAAIKGIASAGVRYAEEMDGLFEANLKEDKEALQAIELAQSLAAPIAGNKSKSLFNFADDLFSIGGELESVFDLINQQLDDVSSPLDEQGKKAVGHLYFLLNSGQRCERAIADLTAEMFEAPKKGGAK